MFAKTRRKLLAVGATLAIAAVAGGGLVIGLGAGDNEVPITGPALQQASDAALEHTGGGRVTDTEVGDEEGFYEVEVTMDDGTEIDVHLDESFNVLGTETDGPGEDDTD